MTEHTEGPVALSAEAAAETAVLLPNASLPLRRAPRGGVGTLKAGSSGNK